MEPKNINRPPARPVSSSPPPAKRQGRPFSPSLPAAQIVICACVIAAVLGFRAFGGGSYQEFRSTYLQTLSDHITLEAITGQLSEWGKSLPVFGFLSDGIQSVFSTTPGEPVESSSDASAQEDSSSEPDASSEAQDSSSSASSDSSVPFPDASLPLAALSASGTPSVRTLAYTGGDTDPLPVSLFGETLSYPPDYASFAPYFLTVPVSLPLSAGRITSSFGYRNYPSPDTESFHRGLDIGAEEGQDIYAILPGKVEECGYQEDGYGHYLIIRHAGGTQTLYAHCSKLLAGDGAVVRQGERIALVGSTGDSTGPHLHLELRINGITMDPAIALNGAYAP